MKVHPRNRRAAGGCCLIPAVVIVFGATIAIMLLIISCVSPEEWDRRQQIERERLVVTFPFNVGDCVVHKSTGATAMVNVVRDGVIQVDLYGNSANIARHPSFTWKWGEAVKIKCPYGEPVEEESK